MVAAEMGGTEVPAPEHMTDADVLDVPNAFAADQLEVYYQPIVDLLTGAVPSVEALVRWHHPRKGLIAPTEFIEQAEQRGLISSITRFVVDTAVAQTKIWTAAGRPLRCSVNLSPTALSDPELRADLLAILSANAGAVTTEITESALADAPAREWLWKLANHGVQVALDDFGTGYSSLAHLKDLPVAVVKIDRTFVRGLPEDASGVAFIRTILQLAYALDLEVIVEGVETEETAAVLRAEGVRWAQGFLFAKPMPLPELDAWLAGRLAIDLSKTPSSLDRGGVDETRVLLECARALVRVSSVEQAVGVLLRAVIELGGTSVPAEQAPPWAIPVDVSLGHAAPLLVVAPAGSPAARTLERVLPLLVEDARKAADNAARIDRLSEQADSDPLTGLGNRRGLGRAPVVIGDTVAMVDLDHFKQVNDTHGHDVGDQVLVAFARTLRQRLRATDLIFRLGGEEFFVIMRGSTPRQAVDLLEQVQGKWVVERPLPITFSAGVASIDDGNLDAAMFNADQALYAAKGRGRDRFEVSAQGRLPAPRRFSAPSRPIVYSDLRAGGASSASAAGDSSDRKSRATAGEDDMDSVTVST